LIKRILIAIACTLFVINCSFAESNESRRQLPVIFNHSWIGLSGGAKISNYSNANLTPYTAQSIKNTIGAMRITLGHYFNPYLAISLSLMRGIHSVKISHVGVQRPTYSVSENVFGLTLRPSLPITDRMGIYGEVGYGLVSREGFLIWNYGIRNSNMSTVLLGAGWYYRFPHNFLIDLEGIYTPANRGKNQPRIIYVGLGLSYMLIDDPSREYGPSYWFPLNVLNINYVNDNIYYWDVARYLTTPRSVPVFFDGHIKVGKGWALYYERNFFHTTKSFSMEWGVSIAGWQSKYWRQSFYTVSLFPELKAWMLRSNFVDLYFTYSLAGPTYISRVYIDGFDSGSNFTFQDFIGLGALLGESKRFNIDVKVIHYSNGNTLPHNPGVCVPVMFGMGATF